VIRNRLFLTLLWLLGFSCTAPQNKQVQSDQVARAASDSVAAAIRQGFSWAAAESIIVNKPKPPVLVSRIIDSKFPPKNLFGIWVLDRTAPHADFWLDADAFYLAEADEEGNRPYLIELDSIKVYYKYFTARGKILKATGDTLVLHFNEGEESCYLRWKE
jgi:hypothetical protein